jgi:hypothetical protein
MKHKAEAEISASAPGRSLDSPPPPGQGEGEGEGSKEQGYNRRALEGFLYSMSYRSRALEWPILPETGNKAGNKGCIYILSHMWSRDPTGQIISALIVGCVRFAK